MCLQRSVVGLRITQNASLSARQIEMMRRSRPPGLDCSMGLAIKCGLVNACSKHEFVVRESCANPVLTYIVEAFCG